MKTDAWIVHADTHVLPQEELVDGSGLPQGYPSGLIGEKTSANLKAIDSRCHHFSWLALETERLGHAAWTEKYGVAFSNMKNAAFAYYARVYTHYARLHDPQASDFVLNVAAGRDLEGRLSTYFLESDAPQACKGRPKPRRECTCVIPIPFQ